jgi:hypothetical protein
VVDAAEVEETQQYTAAEMERMIKLRTSNTFHNVAPAGVASNRRRSAHAANHNQRDLEIKLREFPNATAGR